MSKARELIEAEITAEEKKEYRDNGWRGKWPYPPVLPAAERLVGKLMKRVKEAEDVAESTLRSFRKFRRDRYHADLVTMVAAALPRLIDAIAADPMRTDAHYDLAMRVCRGVIESIDAAVEEKFREKKEGA